MLAAIASGETFNFENETAEGNRAELLALVARAEAGEVLPALAGATSNAAPFVADSIQEEADELAEIVVSLNGKYADFVADSIATICGQMRLIWKDDSTGEVRLSPSVIRRIWPIIRTADGGSEGILTVLDLAVSHFIDGQEQDEVARAKARA
jgi:hypothetical protein